MEEEFKQVCFQIDVRDNVCTALSDLLAGQVKVNGNSTVTEIEIAAPVTNGHKIANREIAAGEPVIKYGVIIGKAACAIGKGEWVHLHNCQSMYDKRSATLDVVTGAPTDTKYE